MRTCTIDDLIAALEEMGDAYGMECEVYFRNDDGYTYGGIDPWDGTLSSGEYDDETVTMD